MANFGFTQQEMTDYFKKMWDNEVKLKLSNPSPLITTPDPITKPHGFFEMYKQEDPDKPKDMKFDGGKILGSVIFQDFPKSINETLGVATFGANKYERSSWKTVKDGETRYLDALFRHILAYAGGEQNDPESGFAHLAHAAWNCLAVLELIKEKNEKA